MSYIKYCPHCGSENFEQISDKEYLCHDCGFDFFTNSAAAVAALITDSRGYLLLTHRARNPWKGSLDLPGGFVDPDESIEEALAREIKEELGAKILSAKYFCSAPNRYMYSGLNVATADVAYLCTLEDASQIKAADDVASYEWIDPLTIDIENLPSSSMRQILKLYLKHIAR